MNNNPSPKPLYYLRILLYADLIVLLKNTRALAISVVAPIYILFISNFNKAARLGSAAFLVVLAITIGLLAMALMGYTLVVARDRERGVFQRLRVTPAPTWVIMLSRLLIQLLADLIITIIILVVGSRLHHLALSSGEYVSVLLVAALAGAVFLSIGQMLVGLIKSATTINAVNGLLYAALLLTGLLGPNGTLGSTIQTISKWTPVGTVMTIFEGALHEVAWNGQSWLSLLVCFGYIVMCASIGIVWFRWDAK